MKVAICTPIYGEFVRSRFANSLVGLVQHCCLVPLEGKTLTPRTFMGGGLLPQARNMVAAGALEWGADWLLWADFDHTFPFDGLHRLLAHDRPFVGANYVGRFNGAPTAVNWIGEDIVPVETTAAKGGQVEAVGAIGMGFALTSRAVMEAVGADPFEFARKGNGGLMGEDYQFCRKAIAAGFQPHVDHPLSMEVGHLAETELRFGR